MGPSSSAPQPPAAPAKPHAPVLPLVVSSVIDIGRLQREVEALEMFLSQAAARQPGQSLSLPRTTKNLEEVCRANNWNLLDAANRHDLTEFLKNMREKAPRVHVSFTADPSAAFLQKIVAWFRSQIHPQVILQVGLQPTIAAGCIVRTSNKYFDLSIRQHFDKRRNLLTEMIKQTRQSGQATVSPGAPETLTSPVDAPELVPQMQSLEVSSDTTEYVAPNPIITDTAVANTPALAGSRPMQSQNGGESHV